MTITPEIAQRFWANVQKTDDCWIWIGTTFQPTRGPRRGRFSIKGKSHSAHRIAWEIETGEWPAPGMCVCHHCDNTLCVRPDHLFVGTQKENVHDGIRKGRISMAFRGPSNSQAKLTEGDVREIIAALAAGQSSKKGLARRYGVDPSAIRQVATGKTWSQVTGINPP